MAPRNKLLETVGGQAIVARVASCAIASGADPVVVVTGFEAERVAEALSGMNVVVVHNPAFAEGLSGSLRAVSRRYRPIAMARWSCWATCRRSRVATFTRSLRRSARDAICVPVHQGKRGNPILWGAAHFAEMMSLTGDVGAKPLLVRHAHRVIEVPVAFPPFFLMSIRRPIWRGSGKRSDSRH